MSIQSIEEDLLIFMGTTTTIEKGGGLIAVTGITQTIAVIVNIIASWTIIIVMYIIITLKNCALIVDSCRMMMSKTLMTSIGVKMWTNTTWCCQVYLELCAQWNSDDRRHTL